jgi:hypothetical protein
VVLTTESLSKFGVKGLYIVFLKRLANEVRHTLGGRFVKVCLAGFVLIRTSSNGPDSPALNNVAEFDTITCPLRIFQSSLIIQSALCDEPAKKVIEAVIRAAPVEDVGDSPQIPTESVPHAFVKAPIKLKDSLGIEFTDKGVQFFELLINVRRSSSTLFYQFPESIIIHWIPQSNYGIGLNLNRGPADGCSTTSGSLNNERSKSFSSRRFAIASSFTSSSQTVTSVNAAFARTLPFLSDQTNFQSTSN